MTANDKLIHHPRETQKEDEHYIHQDESSATVLTCHIGETPHVAQSHGTSRRSEDDANLAAEAASRFFRHTLLYYILGELRELRGVKGS